MCNCMRTFDLCLHLFVTIMTSNVCHMKIIQDLKMT